jgi:hypothetical protein
MRLDGCLRPRCFDQPFADQVGLTFSPNGELHRGRLLSEADLLALLSISVAITGVSLAATLEDARRGAPRQLAVGNREKQWVYVATGPQSVRHLERLKKASVCRSEERSAIGSHQIVGIGSDAGSIPAAFL